MISCKIGDKFSFRAKDSRYLSFVLSCVYFFFSIESSTTIHFFGMPLLIRYSVTAFPCLPCTSTSIWFDFGVIGVTVSKNRTVGEL